MPTPMHVFNEIAARYGVNPDDQKNVRDFFRNTLPSFNEEERRKIFDELMFRDGETKPPSQTPKP